MYLHIYYVAKEGMLPGESISTPRRSVFTFLAKFGQNCIFVAARTLQLASQMPYKEGAWWFIIYITMHSICSGATIVEDRVWITLGQFWRFWSFLTKLNIYIFLIIWIRKMIPTLDNDNITYIQPFQTRNVSRTMLVHRLYRNFDGLAEKHVFYTFFRQIHHLTNTSLK